MPIAGSAAYNALVNAQNQGVTGAGEYNPTSNEVAVISTEQGRKVLDQYIADHNEDTTRITPVAPKDGSAVTTPVTPTSSVNESLKAQGGISMDEVNATGMDTTNYSYDPSTKYWMPKKTDTESDRVNEIYDEEEKKVNDAFAGMNATLDASTQSVIQAYKNIMAQRVADAKKMNEADARNANTVNMRLGFNRYAPMHANRILSDVETAGLERLQKISLDEARLIAEAQQSLTDKKYTAFLAQRNELNDLRKERMATLNKIMDEAKKQREEQQKQARQASRDSAVANLIVQGVTNPAQILDFLNYDQEGNLVGDFTAEELGKTLKNIIPENKTERDMGVDGRMFEFAKENGWLPEGATIFDYWKMETQAKTNPKAEKVGMGAGTPEDYKQFSRENIVLSVIPTQLKNSEAEMTRLLGGIRSGLNAGKTPYEIADNLMGYMIESPSAFSEGLRKYISIADLESGQISELGRLVNAGQHEKAISVIENAIYNKIQEQQKDRFVSEADVIYVKNKADEINQLLGQGWANEVGAFTGTFNTWLTKKFGYGQGSKIQAKVTNLVAELANKRGGSAITEEEWDRLIGPNIPAMNDNANTFKMKLQELVDDPLSRLNAERTAFSLPELDVRQLMNRSLRIPSYSSLTAFDPAGLNEGESDINPNDPVGLF